MKIYLYNYTISRFKYFALYNVHCSLTSMPIYTELYTENLTKKKLVFYIKKNYYMYLVLEYYNLTCMPLVDV